MRSGWFGCFFLYFGAQTAGGGEGVVGGGGECFQVEGEPE